MLLIECLLTRTGYFSAKDCPIEGASCCICNWQPKGKGGFADVFPLLPHLMSARIQAQVSVHFKRRGRSDLVILGPSEIALKKRMDSHCAVQRLCRGWQVEGP
jgi:hypothetical protein